MIIAGLVIGARRGILYIRHEYERPREILQEEIDLVAVMGFSARDSRQQPRIRSRNFRQPRRLHLR